MSGEVQIARNANDRQKLDSIALPKDSERQRKKARSDSSNASGDAGPASEPDMLSLLPLELLAEILVKTQSTRDILAVARCSKYLCKTLVAPSATFIWKKARQLSAPEPMPDPLRILPEPAYAAFVFDGGQCEACKNRTKETYISFAARLRICKAPQCRKSFPTSLGFRSVDKQTSPDQEIWKRVPMLESTIPMSHQAQTVYWPNCQLYCRRKVWGGILNKHRSESRELESTRSNDELQNESAVEIKRNIKWMKFCVAVCKWRDGYVKAYELLRISNRKQASDIAMSKGYLFRDLMESTSYGLMLRIRTKCLENITMRDFDAIASKVDAELALIAEKRRRSQREASYRNVRMAIETHYLRFRAGVPKSILPPFSTFRRLPTFASLLTLADADTSKSIEDMLKTDRVKNIIKSELTKWENDARKEMAAVLGYPDWSRTNETELHPVDRLTACFRCKACSERNNRQDPGCLNFAKACMHQCPSAQESKRGSGPWSASSFVKHDKAIAAMKKLLGMNGLDETRHSIKQAQSLYPRMIQCLSCKPYSILKAGKVVSHCLRHETMEMRMIEEHEGDKGLQFALTYSLCGLDVAEALLKRSIEARAVKDCGCPYCLYDTAKDAEIADPKSLDGKLKRMTVFGLRSHLQTKHGISMLRDEDVFVFPTCVSNARTTEELAKKSEEDGMI
ncbi:hypothetical protein AX17_002467 [Amanita inopinata Kibby_2008]|nr:hypothetical protein AX17_002467 [Amanita inopinata Kibby_2008]